MSDTNEIRFSGTIERMKEIKTKTGTSMASFLLKVGRDRFKVVAFKNIADAILKCDEGTKVSVSGSGSINSWKDDQEHWHNDFQCTAWGIEISGSATRYEKKNNSTQQQSPLPRKHDNRTEYDYAGGPF